MSKSMTKFFLVVALAGVGAVACSSSSTPAGQGGNGGHATGGAGGTTAAGGAGGTAAGGAGGTAAGGAGGTAAGGAGGTSTGGAGGTGAGGASAATTNMNLLNATTTSTGITPTRTVPTFTAQTCPS